jgi:thiol-disulfide isomerase/thioredoxin
MKHFFVGFCLLLFISTRSSAQEIPVWKLGDLQRAISEDTSVTYVVNFWATWCAPCIKEMPYFEQLNAEADKHNIKVLLVSLDFPEQLESRVKPFIGKRNISSQVVILDEPNYNRWIPLISEQWSGSIPATLCVNKSKGIYEFKEAEFKQGQLNKWLEMIGAF